MRSIALALGIALACGCGDDGGGGGDADAGERDDAGSDPDASAATTVRVTALDDAGAAEVGVQVLFLAADGSLVLDTITDSAGQASAEMLPGGSATLIRARSAEFFGVTTFLDLPPNADVVSRPFIDEEFTPVNVSWPQEPNSNLYRVFADCPTGNPGTGGRGVQTADLSVVLQVRTDCADDFTVLVKAENGMGLAPQTLSAGGQSAPTAVLTGDYNNIQALPIAVTGIPVDLAGPIGFAGAAWYAGALPQTEFLSASASLDGAGTGSFNAALGAGRAIQMLMSNATGSQVRLDRLDAGVNELDVNLDGEMLPWFVGTVEFDQATRELAWLQEDPVGSTAAVPSLVMAQIEYRRSPISIHWHVIAPGTSLVDGSIADQKVLRFPDLPGELPFEPLEGDSFGQDLITLFAVNPEAVNGAYNVLEPHRGRLDLFGVEGLTRVTAEAGF